MLVGGEIEGKPPWVPIWKKKKFFGFANVVVDIVMLREDLIFCCHSGVLRDVLV
jgi:hypothetical protein